MLLKHLYQFAHSPHLKILADDAFEARAIRFVIDLSADGTVIGVQDISPDGKRGFEFPAVPKTARVKKGKVAEFLADGLDSLFGLSPDPTKPKDPDMLRAKFDDFWLQIAEAEGKTKHVGLAGLVKFKPSPGEPPSFLNLDDDKWTVTTASGAKIRVGSAAFTFRVNGELLFTDQAGIAPYWRSVFARTISDEEGDSEIGRCLITGEPDVPIARTHTPRVGNIPNLGIDGTIVAFEKSAPAFSSYGKIQSNNAPCSVSATRAYSKGLQFLVDHAEHHVAIGKTKLCFWAAETPIAKTPFGFLNRPDPKVIRDFVRAPFAGVERDIVRRERFYAVTLAGNSGRIVVRHWMDVSLEQAVGNLHQWFLDLEIATPERPPRKAKPGEKQKDFHPLSIYWLSRTTVSDEAAKKLEKNLPPEVPSMLYRAALEGTAPSISLLKPILNQLHSRLVRDDTYNLLYDESRFALLKLILNRQPNRSMEIQPTLIADTDDAAYNCGRLLSVLNETQKKAHEYQLKGATVVEKFFGTASTSPSYVFPYLLKLNRHHLQKIRKSLKYGGGERFLEEAICDILARLGQSEAMRLLKAPPTFPRTLDLQGQGRFSLGFYQQTAADVIARQAYQKAAEPVESSVS